MKLVVDTNILFSLFKKDSYVRKIIREHDMELISPEFSLEELEKHSETIIKKSGIGKAELNIILEELKIIITFISEDKYLQELKIATKLAEKFSSKDKTEYLYDIDFIALALKEKCPIWSNDRLLKKQAKIKVINTGEIMEYITK